MIETLFNQAFDNLVQTIGSPVLACILIMAVFFFALLYCGLEFDFALIMIAPIPLAFNTGGYLEVWIAALFIILPLGVGIWSVWVKFSQR